VYGAIRITLSHASPGVARSRRPPGGGCTASWGSEVCLVLLLALHVTPIGGVLPDKKGLQSRMSPVGCSSSLSFAVAISVHAVTGGTSPWLLPTLWCGSGPRLCRGSAGQPAATRRHLRPTVTAAHAWRAAHCRPQRRGLTGVGSGGCPCSRGPDRGPAVRHVPVSRSRGRALRGPPAADVFCAAASPWYLLSLGSDALTAARPWCF
jgi:hypothetical protein